MITEEMDDYQALEEMKKNITAGRVRSTDVRKLTDRFEFLLAKFYEAEQIIDGRINAKS